MTYYCIAALIYMLGGGVLWFGILSKKPLFIFIGAAVELFGVVSSVIKHLIMLDKRKHRSVNHYDCLLQRWYTAVISVLFSLGCAIFWVAFLIKSEPALYIGIASHVLVIFTVFFDRADNKYSNARHRRQ